MYGVLTAVVFPLPFPIITAYYCVSFNMAAMYEAITVLSMQHMNMCVHIYRKLLFSFYFFTSMSLF